MPRHLQNSPAILVLVATFTFAGAAAAQDQPSKPKAETEGIALTIGGDIDAKMTPIAGRLSALYFDCYPKLVARFEHPDKPAKRHIRLVFSRDLKIPGYCTGDTIVVSVGWLTDHPDDIGLFTHELTHAVQAYPKADPSWLTEGLADYSRQLYGPEKQPEWELPPRLTDRNSYKESYRVSARFLVWLDEKHPGVVDKLHRRMQDGAFTLDDFKTETGKSVDELWAECVKDLST